MAHFPKPFFRKDRGLWYVQREKQINLGPDRDTAFRQYGELIAKPRPARLRMALIAPRGVAARPSMSPEFASSIPARRRSF